MQISHFGSLLPDGALLLDTTLLPDAAAVASSRALSAESPAERQLLRTDFRLAPSLSQCCAGASESVLHWVSDSALHRVFDSALHWCPCRAAASFGASDFVLHWCPCRQHLMGASGSALYRRPLPATPHGRLKLCAVPAPRAGNKPHLAAKSTPVWLAIWRTWAGFANSQLRCAAFRSTY